MTDTAVVNASPLIYLARANYLHLLQVAAPEILVPDVVAEEINARDTSDPAVRALREIPWLRQVEAPSPPRSVLGWDLGAGESAVIAWALTHSGTLAIIDDLEGRRCAETLGVRLRGTLGLVLRARRQGVFPHARPVLDTLRTAGMYLSDGLIEMALAEIGETAN